MPGHYLQLMHANRYDSPLRAVLASSAFIEGWAVYTEGMMVQEGFLNHDPLMHLIQLKMVPAHDRQRDPRPGCAR